MQSLYYGRGRGVIQEHKEEELQLSAPKLPSAYLRPVLTVFFLPLMPDWSQPNMSIENSEENFETQYIHFIMIEFLVDF